MFKLQHLAAAIALSTASLAASAAGSLALAPANTLVNVGQSFGLQVQGQGFTDNVIGGGFNLSWNPLLLSLDSVAVNTSVWEMTPSNGSAGPAGSWRDVSFNTFAATLPTGDFSVATLQFTALAAGSSTVSLAASPSFVFADGAGDPISGISFGSATVTAVPEPAGWAMMLAGLALLPLLRRRA